jgi:hypothetical protein
MNHTIRKRLLLGGFACVLILGLTIAILDAGSYIKEKESYIEVGGGKIAYVPRTTQFVKVDGQVKKIARFATTLSSGEEDCACPNCCKGYCYVIVYTDSGSVGKPAIILAVIWVRCG